MAIHNSPTVGITSNATLEPAHPAYSNPELEEGTHLFRQLCEQVEAVAKESAEKGRVVTIIQAFKLALAGMELTPDERVRLWVTLESAVRVLRKPER